MFLLPRDEACRCAMSLEQILALDDEAFVGTVYRTLMGRDADEDGFWHYLGQLQAGMPRMEILAALRLSPEGRLRPEGLPGLDAAIEDHQTKLSKQEEPAPISEATRLCELLALSDRAFVERAFLTIVGRAPDPDGFEHYLQRLRGEISKEQIIAEMCLSKEARGRETGLSGLEQVVKKYRRRKLPIIGWLFRMFGARIYNGRVEIGMSYIDTKFEQFARENDSRLNRLEDLLIQRSRLIAEQVQSLSRAVDYNRLENRNDRLEPRNLVGKKAPSAAVATILTARLHSPTFQQAYEPEGLEFLPAPARTIYFQLKTRVFRYGKR